MKNNKGILTIEASLVLTFFIMFILFFLSFGRVYRAQNIVSHGVLQAADSISTESYIRENTPEDSVSDVLYVSQHIYGGDSVSEDALTSLKKVNFSKLAKDKFTAVVAEDTSKADAVLRSVGVKDGLSGIDFTKSKLKSSDDETIIYASYTVELQFPLFGVREFNMSKAAKVRNMGAETYLVEVSSADKTQGSTSGNVKVRQNGSTVITANPEWGFRFVKWQDGNTDNPRTISNISSDKSFVAYFERESYGVKVKCIPDGSGTAKGVGEYNLNDVATVTVSPKEGYLFSGWDNNGDGVADSGASNPTRQVRVENDVTLTAVFKLAPSIEVKTEDNLKSYSQNGWVEISSAYSSYQAMVNTSNSYSATHQLKANVKGANGAKVVWSSSNTSVATVNSSGVVTAVGSGTAIITASITVDGVTYSSKTEITTKMFLEHYMLRIYDYRGDRYKYRRWLDSWNGSYSYNGKLYTSNLGCWYRAILIDNPGNRVVESGKTTANVATNKTYTGSNNSVMHGTNDSGKTGYVIYVDGVMGWSAGHGDYVFFPRSGNSYVIQNVTILN